MLNKKSNKILKVILFFWKHCWCVFLLRICLIFVWFLQLFKLGVRLELLRTKIGVTKMVLIDLCYSLFLGVTWCRILEVPKFFDKLFDEIFWRYFLTSFLTNSLTNFLTKFLTKFLTIFYKFFCDFLTNFLYKFVDFFCSICFPIKIDWFVCLGICSVTKWAFKNWNM